MNDFGTPRLVLAYRHQQVRHVVGLRLTHGTDPLDSATLTPHAIDFANALSEVTAPNVIIDGAYTQNRYGLKLIELDLGEEIAGVHTTATSNDRYSFSTTYVGRSGTVGSGGHVGHTLVRVFPGLVYLPGVGEKDILLGVIDASNVFGDWLTGTAPVFADFYGNKCVLQRKIKLQYNAAIQKSYGS